jgi:hypothetical protein
MMGRPEHLATAQGNQQIVREIFMERFVSGASLYDILRHDRSIGSDFQGIIYRYPIVGAQNAEAVPVDVHRQSFL